MMNPVSIARKRASSVFIYTVGAVLVFISGVSMFGAVDQGTEFAVAIFGSIIGGFLGALLATMVVVDLYTRNSGRDED